MAFVVDFGGGTGQVSDCLQVPVPDNGYAALAEFPTQKHLALPAHSSGGLLCSIGDVPASGCGRAASGGYTYWSYFRGGAGTWPYATTGAFGTVTPGDVEGWWFQNPGAGNPNDPPPRVAPDYRVLCPTTTTTTVPARGVAPGGTVSPGPPRAAAVPSSSTHTTALGTTAVAANQGAGRSGLLPLVLGGLVVTGLGIAPTVRWRRRSRVRRG